MNWCERPPPAARPLTSSFSLSPFSLRRSSNIEHYADELEDELAEAMLADFGAQLEDDSPREVKKKKKKG